MGYLDNRTIVIDAILTNKGRELLSKGTANFKITKFALSDDEIDYKLWNPNHNLGSDYYGEAIEAIPIMEASSNESQVMKYKLVSLPQGTTQMAVMNVGPLAVTMYRNGTYVIAPSITNNPDANAVYGYTAILSSGGSASIRVVPGYELTNNFVYADPNDIFDEESGTANATIIVSGKRFEIKTPITFIGTITKTVTIVANETGNTETIVLTLIGGSYTPEE